MEAYSRHLERYPGMSCLALSMQSPLSENIDISRVTLRHEDKTDPCRRRACSRTLLVYGSCRIKLQMHLHLEEAVVRLLPNFHPHFLYHRLSLTKFPGPVLDLYLTFLRYFPRGFLLIFLTFLRQISRWRKNSRLFLS